VPRYMQTESVQTKLQENRGLREAFEYM
jgi:hypothetical protein